MSVWTARKQNPPPAPTTRAAQGSYTLHPAQRDTWSLEILENLCILFCISQEDDDDYDDDAQGLYKLHPAQRDTWHLDEIRAFETSCLDLECFLNL